MLASLLAPLLVTTVLGSDFEYEALPVPPVSVATDINNEGQIVGTTFSMGPPQAFLIADGVTTIFGFPGAVATTVSGISDVGDIVGDYSLTGSPFDTHAFMQNAAGIFTSFDFPGPTTVFTRGIGINNRGDVVGFYLDAVDLELHGYVRYKDGTFQAIDHPSAVGLTLALGISDKRVISGIYNDAQLGVPETAYLLNDGVFTDAVVPGSFSTNAIDINNSGSFVGNYHAVSPNPFAPGGPAYVHDRHGVTIVEFPGAEDTDLAGINGRGDVVGAFFPDELGPPFAFVARRPQDG